MRKEDVTDEATGLPPLDQPTEEDSIWVMAMTGGQADVLSPLDGSPRGSMVLSIRGLIKGKEGMEWGQVHVVFPHGSVQEMRKVLDAYLEEYPEATQ